MAEKTVYAGNVFAGDALRKAAREKIEAAMSNPIGGGLANIVENTRRYSAWLMQAHTPLIVLAGIGLAAPWATRRAPLPWRAALLFLSFTLGLAVWGLFPWSQVPAYIGAQLLGAMAGQLAIVATHKPYYDRTTDPDSKARLAKAVDNWKQNAARYNDEPDTNEGRKQLSARAKAAEHQRDEALSRYHNFEFASAAFQIGIVLASAEVITGMVALGWLSGALGIVGLAFMSFGLWAPHALDFILHASH